MRNYNEDKISSIPRSFSDQIKGKILDIGCNECIIPEKWGVNKENYIGLDIDVDALKMAKERGFNVKKVELEKEGIPLRDSSIDSFICLDVLEHLPDPVRIIRDIKRVVKKDAFGIISLPNDLNLVNLTRVFLLGSPIITKKRMWDPHSHLHFPPIKESKKLINKHFEIVDIIYRADGYTVPLLSRKLKNLLARISPRFFARNTFFFVKGTKQNVK